MCSKVEAEFVMKWKRWWWCSLLVTGSYFTGKAWQPLPPLAFPEAIISHFKSRNLSSLLLVPLLPMWLSNVRLYVGPKQVWMHARTAQSQHLFLLCGASRRELVLGCVTNPLHIGFFLTLHGCGCNAISASSSSFHHILKNHAVPLSLHPQLPCHAVLLLLFICFCAAFSSHFVRHRGRF